MSTLRKVLITSLREKVTNELQALYHSRNSIVRKERGEGNGKARKHVASVSGKCGTRSAVRKKGRSSRDEESQGTLNFISSAIQDSKFSGDTQLSVILSIRSPEYHL